MVPLEPAPDPFRLEVAGAKVRVGPAVGWICLNRPEQVVGPLWRLASGRHGSAPLAGPESREEGTLSVCVELDVLWTGFPGRAGRPAENPCGLDGRDEHAVVGGVPTGERGEHFGSIRQSDGRHGSQSMWHLGPVHRRIGTEFDNDIQS